MPIHLLLFVNILCIFLPIGGLVDPVLRAWEEFPADDLTSATNAELLALIGSEEQLHPVGTSLLQVSVITTPMPLGPATPSTESQTEAQLIPEFLADMPFFSRAQATAVELSDKAIIVTKHFVAVVSAALWQYVCGLALIFFTLPVLWQNERRRARLDALIVYGRSEVKAVSAHDKLNPKNRGSLVHVSGGSTIAKEPIKDPWFRDVEVRTNCVRLRTEVELCQWVAEPRKASKDQRVPKFTYKSQWASSWHHSDMFCDKTKKKQNPSRPHLGNQHHPLQSCRIWKFCAAPLPR